MLTRLELEAIGGALLLVAALCGFFWVEHLGAEKSEAARTAERAQAQAVAASAIAANTIETSRRVAAVQGAASAAELQASSAAADAAGARSAADRLRVRLAAADSRAASVNPQAASAGAPANPAPGVPADLFWQVVDDAGRYAVDADNARIAGSACERAYGALTP